jgi:hypothetical protein
MKFKMNKILVLIISKIVVLNYLFLETISWQQSNILSNLTLLINRTYWRDQFIKKTTINNDEYLIFYGGRSN